ncbi:UDP-GalNAc:beta-1,3-N-acetylgalactosaminyltransferase 1-like [Acanthaster planci]|uniref:Hexosyltransferase n=1 Tax=Acanthaster planci TaxID=133434 RepID=A0A8B7Z2H5_ACAPL|nr:UDP-GalNAc:beta-1,3-N-acetylgalactosaminyltransferase 1-like [Acanthaster planci]
MVTADFITKRHFAAYEVSMSGEPDSTHAPGKGKVLVASSATVQPTDMSNGKGKKRRGRVPSFINPLTGRPTSLALAVIILAAVLIVYLMSRAKGGGSADSIDERAKNPKFQHILVPADDPRGLNVADEVNFPHVQRPNVAGQDEAVGKALAFPKIPPPPGRKPLPQAPDANRKKPELPRDPPPKPKEFPVNVIRKPNLLCPDKPYVLFLVVCLPNEVLARTAVRRTWGAPNGIAEAKSLALSWRAVFVMGRTAAKDDQIERESNNYGDILQGEFDDLSSEVTRKVMLGFQWSDKDIPDSCRPLYVFKTNIRVYINLPLIVPWIQDKLKMASNLYVGKMLREDRPIRDTQDPLYVPNQDYPGNVFPNLARGPLYMLSMDVVQRMVPHFGSVTPIAMEDAYVGVLANYVGAPITNDDHFVLLKKPKNFCHYRHMMFVFDIEPTELVHVYKVVEEKHRYSECTDRGF